MVYDKIVSQNVKTHRFEELKSLLNDRVTKHSDYYKNQQLLIGSYTFIKKLIDFITQNGYNN